MDEEHVALCRIEQLDLPVPTLVAAPGAQGYLPPAEAPTNRGLHLDA